MFWLNANVERGTHAIVISNRNIQQIVRTDIRLITFEKLSVVQTEIHIFIHRIFYVIFNIPIPYAPSMVNGVQVEFVVIGVIVTDVYVYTFFDYKLLKYIKKKCKNNDWKIYYGYNNADDFIFFSRSARWLVENQARNEK